MHPDEVGVEVFGVDCTIAPHDDLGVFGDASQGYQRGAVAEVVFHHIAVEGQVNVAAALLDVEVESSRPNGVDDGMGRVDGKFLDASDGIGAA